MEKALCPGWGTVRRRTEEYLKMNYDEFLHSKIEVAPESGFSVRRIRPALRQRMSEAMYSAQAASSTPSGSPGSNATGISRSNSAAAL